MTGIVMCAETIAKPENKVIAHRTKPENKVIAHKNPKKHWRTIVELGKRD